MINSMIKYLIVGIFVSLFMIWYYRKDGTTKVKYELYFAVIGPLIWPLQIIKFTIDEIRELFNKNISIWKKIAISYRILLILFIVILFFYPHVFLPRL
jgi:hypothetical protein